jgi:hypothetical protein
LRCADGVHRPVIGLPVRDEGSDADDRVVDMLRKFFAHRETVPDLGGFAAANDLVGKSDAEVREDREGADHRLLR